MRDSRFPVTVTDGIPVVTAPEEIDVTNAEGLRAALLIAGNSGHLSLVVDMTRTNFCDSAGLHTLVAAQKRARDHEGEVLLALSGTAVPRLLALTGLDSQLPSFPTLEQALAAAATGNRNGHGSPDAAGTGLP